MFSTALNFTCLKKITKRSLRIKWSLNIIQWSHNWSEFAINTILFPFWVIFHLGFEWFTDTAWKQATSPSDHAVHLSSIPTSSMFYYFLIRSRHTRSNLQWLSLGYGRKPEHLEETYGHRENVQHRQHPRSGANPGLWHCFKPMPFPSF